ncbi:DUF1206 domain-containing protein [Nocardioides pacificus]
MAQMKTHADDLGRRAEDSDWIDRAVRFGLVVYGVVHLVIAWLALQLALGDQEGSASSTGALHELAQQSFGRVLIWLVAFGMALLVLWRLLEMAVGHREDDGADLWKHRAGDAFKAIVYGALAFTAFQVAQGAGSSGGSSGGSGGKKGGGGGSSSDGYTAQVMNWPGGQFLVGAAGLAVIGYGAVQIWKGLSEKHTKDLASEGKTGDAGRAYILLGKIGYVAKGVAVGVIGALFVYAAATHDPKKSGGLDEALHKVLQQPFGPFLLGAIALGIGCYGLFCFARARHLSR